jgi:DNA-binding response OmpR family regulator
MLLDINMPGLDGWATLRLLRADEAYDDLKVAMFSGEVRGARQGRERQDGAIDYLTKPFGVDELVTRVSRILAPAADGASAVPSASPR